MIIALNGYSGSGKDTVAAIIQYLMCDEVGTLEVEDVIKYYKTHSWYLEQQSGWEIKKFAGKLKTIASLMTGIPETMFEDQEFKKKNLPQEWSKHGLPITVREFLQKLGTDAIRNELCDNAWVNALFADYKAEKLCDCEKECRCKFKYPDWVITDCRFANEVHAIRRIGGIVIRIDRPDISPVNRHVSETAIDRIKFDYKILNNSDYVGLALSVATILQKLGYEPKRIPSYSTSTN